MKKLFLFVLALLAFSVHVQAQYNRFEKFAQPTLAPLQFNPAFAGSMKDSRLNIGFQNSNYNLLANPNNTYISYDQLSNRLKGGIGVEANLTRLSFSQSASMSFSYAGKIHLGGRWTLSPAIKVRGEYLRIANVEEFDPVVISGRYRRANLVLMPGVLLNSPNFFVGASLYGFPKFQLHNSEKGNVTFPGAEILPRTTLNLQAGFRYAPQKDWSISASVISAVDASSVGGSVQAIFRYKPLLIGGGISMENLRPVSNGVFTSEQFVSLGYKHKRFRILGSYTFSRANNINFDSWEIGMTFYFPRKLQSSEVAGL